MGAARSDRGPKRMPFSPTSLATRGIIALLLTASAVSPLSAAPKTNAKDAPPELVSTKSGGPKWSTIKELAAAADRGDAVAAFEYARLLETGAEQLPANPQRALEYYRRAAEAGHGDALFRLAKITHDGQLGVAVNYPEALALYRKAAAAGVPEAMYNIGSLLVSARGVKRDYVDGLAWLIVAAEKGADAQAGIQQVRERLKRRPETIVAAERRAEEIRDELAGKPREEATAKFGPPALNAPAPLRPTIDPPQPPPVVIEKPTIPTPKP